MTRLASGGRYYKLESQSIAYSSRGIHPVNAEPLAVMCCNSKPAGREALVGDTEGNCSHAWRGLEVVLLLSNTTIKIWSLSDLQAYAEGGTEHFLYIQTLQLRIDWERTAQDAQEEKRILTGPEKR